MNHRTEHPDCYDEHGRPLFDVSDIEDSRIEQIREYCELELAMAQQRSMPGVPDRKATEPARCCRVLIGHLGEILDIIGEARDE